jgi:hypothetical protein
MESRTLCRKCGAPMDPPDRKFCSQCGAPISSPILVKHDDAIREFEHHESVLQNYRAMFLVSETFTASLAATRVNVPGSETLVSLLAVFGIAWLVIWIIVTDLRARVVRFFEEHDEDGALMRYHKEIESLAHRAGFWFFTVVFPATFALLWLSLLLIAYGIV